MNRACTENPKPTLMWEDAVKNDVKDLRGEPNG